MNFLKIRRFAVVEIEIFLFHYQSNSSFGGKIQKRCMVLAVLFSDACLCNLWPLKSSFLSRWL